MKNLFARAKCAACSQETASPAQVKKAMILLAATAAAGMMLLLHVTYKHFRHIDGVGKLRVLSSSGEVIAVSKPYNHKKATFHKPKP